MTHEQILQKIQEILAQDFDISPDKVTREAGFRSQLGLDSLDVVDLAYLIQREFGLDKEMQAYRGLHTVGMVVDFVHDQISE